jgi:cell division protein FtsA
MLPEFIVSIDLGSERTSVLVGEVMHGGAFRIIGASSRPSAGIKKGTVIDMEDAAECVRETADHAARMAGVEIDCLCAGMSASHIRSFNSRGMISVPRDRREITEADVDHVNRTASNITLPSEMEILHSIPQDYVVDAHRGISDPVGMTASRLGVEIHLVSVQAVHVENTVKVIEKAGFEVVNVIFNPIAAAHAVLLEEEKDAGCLLIDMGACVSSFALFGGGSIRSSGVLAAGGDNVTNDLAVGLRIPKGTAEEVKLRWGLALASLADEDEVLTIPGAGSGEGEIRRQIIAAIMEPRCEEIFSMIKSAVSNDPHFRAAGSTVVLTGGGSKIEGLEGVAEQVFDRPVRTGRPHGLSGLSEIVSNESWSAAVGLLLFEKDRLEREEEMARGRGRFGMMLGNLKRLAGMF